MNVFGELVRAQLELLSSDPTPGITARMFYNTTDGFFRYDNGSAIKELADTNSAQTFSSKTLTDPVFGASGVFTEISTPANPSAGNRKIYAKTTGIFALNSAGVEKQLDSSASFSAVTKNTTATLATSGEEIVLANASGGAFTLNLPAASGNSGLLYKIIKTDSSTNIVTIDPNGAETINGASTTTLNTQYEEVEIVCDGSNWTVLNRKATTGWSSYSLTIGGTGSAPTKGTIVRDIAQWRREGSDMLIRYDYEASAAGAAGSGTYLFPLPAGFSVDTSIVGTTSQNEIIVGSGILGNKGDGLSSATRDIFVNVHDSNNLSLSNKDTINSYLKVGSSSFALSEAEYLISYTVRVPIAGWNS